MSRREFPAKVKVAAFQRANGRCEACTAKLMPGKIRYDHILPDQLGGEPTLENCACICSACHTAKTSRQDVPAIAKAKRIQQKHLLRKTSSRPLPGSKASGWRKPFNRPPERRA